MARRRIVKRKTGRKPDEFISTWAKIIRYLYENQLLFYVTVSLVVAALVGIIGGSFLYFHRQTESQEILNNGIQLYHNAGSSEEELGEALLVFNTVAKKYPLSRARKIAILYKGDVLFDLKKYDEALDAFESAERKLNGPLKDIASKNIGYSYEQLGDYEEASEVFKRLISPNREDAYLDLIRNLEKAGKKDEVKTYAKEYLTHFPDSSRAPAIKERIGETGDN